MSLRRHFRNLRKLQNYRLPRTAEGVRQEIGMVLEAEAHKSAPLVYRFGTTAPTQLGHTDRQVMNDD